MTLVAVGGLAMIGAWTGTRTGMGFSTNRNSKPREVTYHHCYNGSRGLIVSEPQPARVLSIHPVGFGLFLQSGSGQKILTQIILLREGKLAIKASAKAFLFESLKRSARDETQGEGIQLR